MWSIVKQFAAAKFAHRLRWCPVISTPHVPIYGKWFQLAKQQFSRAKCQWDSQYRSARFRYIDIGRWHRRSEPHLPKFSSIYRDQRSQRKPANVRLRHLSSHEFQSIKRLTATFGFWRIHWATRNEFCTDPPAVKFASNFSTSSVYLCVVGADPNGFIWIHYGSEKRAS